jgi:hypothetical protein
MKNLTAYQAIEAATLAIRAVCRETEPDGSAVIIADLASHEIEVRVIKAVKKAIETAATK